MNIDSSSINALKLLVYKTSEAHKDPRGSTIFIELHRLKLSNLSNEDSVMELEKKPVTHQNGQKYFNTVLKR